MTIARAHYTIEYLDNKIILHGDISAIHKEAELILRRFACSARPYRVHEDNGQQIVLTLAH